jgi:hypothetical protein
VIADDCNQIIQHHDLAHTGNGKGSAIVDVSDRTAEHRARSVGRKLHSRRQDVDAVLHLTIDLARSVESLQRPAYQPEGAGVLEWWVLRRRDRRGAAG